MATVTVRDDVTSEEVARALTDRLSPRYRVELGKKVRWGFGRAEDADADSIVVSAGSGRFWRTQVSIERRDGRNLVRIEPPGPIQLWLANTAGIARRVRHALLDTPGLRAT